jgi:hypothetical protein
MLQVHGGIVAAADGTEEINNAYDVRTSLQRYIGGRQGLQFGSQSLVQLSGALSDR